MASYQEHLAKQQARQAASGDVKIHFMNEFLKEDGDTAIIRFPYKSMDDIVNNITDTVDILKVIKPIYNFKAGKE